MRSLFTLVLVAVVPCLTSAYPAFESPSPTPTPTPTATNICPTICPTSTSTTHPGYYCPPDAPSETLDCPVARCISQEDFTTTITSIIPCSTEIITTTGGCTVPQSCVGLPVPTVTVSAETCPETCPELCTRPTVTESRLLGGGCARTA